MKSINWRKIINAIAILIILCVIAFVANYIISFFSTIYFKESETNTTNPGRGFYKTVYSDHLSDISETVEKGYSLALIVYDIENYKDGLIDEEKLNELDEALIDARKHGLKVILRVAYGFSSDSRDPEDIKVIEKHFEQIEPVIKKNNDVIFVVQAGMLGPWGEWHNSSFGDPPSLEVRKIVVDTWLDILDNDTYVVVRRPSFVRDMYDVKLNEENAYMSEDVSRVGWHNDALLSTQDDMGTYTDLSRKSELKWSENHNLYVPFGGETNKISELNDSKNAVYEFEKLRISYLNSEYHDEILESWKNEIIDSENAYDYFEKRLGYRLVIRNVEINSELRANSNTFANMNIDNVGFGAVYNEYEVNIVLMDDAGNVFKNKVEIDIRKIYPEKEISFKAKIKVPKEFSDSESIMVGLEICDSEKSLRDDIRYNIELSNEEIKYIDGVNYFVNYIADNRKYVMQ